MPNYEIYVRDHTLNKVGIITVFKSLEMRQHFLFPGGWVLELPNDANQGAQALLSVVETGMLAGIVVIRDGEIIFSGSITGYEATGDYTNRIEGEDLRFFGIDDTGLLSSRLCAVDKGGGYIFPSGVGYGYDTNGPSYTETILRKLVNDNCINASGREIPRLELTNNGFNGISDSVSNARYNNLLIKMRSVAYSGSVGFYIQQGTGSIYDPALLFKVYTPRNLENSVIFSKGFGNLSSYRYMLQYPGTNTVIVGGKEATANDVTTRTFYSKANTTTDIASKYGRWETMVDRRDTSDNNELEQEANVQFDEHGSVTELEIEAINKAPTRFWTDYNLGDRVSVVLDNATIQDVIRGVTIQLTYGGAETIKPWIGTKSIRSNFRIFDEMKKLNTRVQQLETSF